MLLLSSYSLVQEVSASEKLEIKPIPKIKKIKIVPNVIPVIKTLRKLGGSSTGGGSDRAEKFKAIAHIYANNLIDISQEERETLDISVTKEEVLSAINLFSEKIVELQKEDNFNILDKDGKVIAQVINGRILEKSRHKDAYVGAVTKDYKSELYIFLSLTWSTQKYTVPIKEYLRVLNKENEIAAIINFSSSFPRADISVQNLWQSRNRRLPNIIIEKTFVVNKTSGSVLIDRVRKRLIKKHGNGNMYNSILATAVREYLKRNNRMSALEYANRICRSEWDTQMFRAENYLYAELVDFKMKNQSCKFNEHQQYKCVLSWEVHCQYGYSNKISDKLKDFTSPKF